MSENNEKRSELLSRTLAELNDRYTGLPDDYRRWVRALDIETLKLVYQVALRDAPGSEIEALLGC